MRRNALKSQKPETMRPTTCLQLKFNLSTALITFLLISCHIFPANLKAQRPDLTIQFNDIPSQYTIWPIKGIFPFPPLTDRPTVLSLILKNEGVVSVEEEFPVQLLVDGVVKDSWVFSPIHEEEDILSQKNVLQPGGNRPFGFDLKFTSPGHHQIQIVVDPDDIIKESDESTSSNIIDTVLNWQYPPDLVVDFIASGQVSGGQKSDWIVIVTNQGKGDVHEPFQTTFFPSVSGGMQENFIIDNLKAGHSVYKTFPQSFQVWGNYLFSAEVDVMNRIAESDENNNKAEKIIELQTVDLSVKSFEYEKKKNQIILRFTIINNGPGDANLPFKVSLWPGEIQLNHVVSPKIFEVSPLPAKHQITLEHTLSLNPGNYEVLVYADAVNPVYFEKNNINNTWIETISVSSMPENYNNANKEKWDRMDNIVKAILTAYNNDGRKLNHKDVPWNEKHETASKIIASGLYALSRPSYFSALFDQMGGEENFRNDFQKKVTEYLEGIYPYTEVGTNGDYDMALSNLATILYGFIDRPELLTNDMIWFLIYQSRDQNWWTEVQWRYNLVGQRQVLDYTGWIVQSETENHVLMIHIWKYLINQYIFWVGKYLHENDPKHPRYDKRIHKLYSENTDWYDNLNGGLEELLFKVVGRFLHNGVFEENARPYESLSFHAIMNLFMGTSAINIPEGDKIKYPSLANDELNIATQNAMEFLIAKFTFQSFEGKRLTPFRRNYENRRKYGIGASDYLMDMVGMLSSAYVFNDDYEDQSFIEINRYPKTIELWKVLLNTGLEKNKILIDNQGQFFVKETIYKSRYRWQDILENRAASYALWTTLVMFKTDYTLPASIHDFLLNKHQGYWARINSIYTNDHYDWEARPGSKPALYFYNKNGKYVRYVGGYLSSSPEFYFCTSDFLNSSGGIYQQYNKRLQGLDNETNQYNFNSVPYTVIPTGDVGRFWGLDGDNFDEMSI